MSRGGRSSLKGLMRWPTGMHSDVMSYQPRERPDIIFAYANVFGFKYNDEFVPLSDRKILAPDKMFHEIEQACENSKKPLSLHKRILND